MSYDRTYKQTEIPLGQTCSGTCENNPPCFPIPVPDNDTRIKTHKCIEFTRSSASCGSGNNNQLKGTV